MQCSFFKKRGGRLGGKEGVWGREKETESKNTGERPE